MKNFILLSSLVLLSGCYSNQSSDTIGQINQEISSQSTSAGKISLAIETGENYYVSQDDGNNNNDGLTLDMPLKTIQYAIDIAVPGDTINIKESINYYPAVVIRKSGVKGLPITIQGVGNNARPIISGSRLVDDWRESDNLDVWEMETSANPNLVVEDNKNLIKASSRQLDDGQWFFESNHLYYKPTSGLPSNHTVWRSQRAGGMKLIGVSWIVVKNIDFYLGQGAGVELKGSNHNIIQNVLSKWHWQGIRITSDSNYNKILNVEATENREGIYISFQSSFNTIKNCKSFWNGNLPYWSKGDRGGVLIGEGGPNTGNVIEGCEIAFNGGPDSDPALIAYKAPNSVLKNNNIHHNYGSGLFITIWSNDSVVNANVVSENGRQAVLNGYKGISGLSIRRTKNVLVQDNVVIDNYVSPDSRWIGKDLGPKGGLDLQGNSNDTMENIHFIQNTVSGTKGGPDMFFSKVPKTPGLIVE